LKRNELLKILLASGCKLHRHGGNHDIYVNEKTGQKQPVPRHNEINEHLAKHIIKYLSA
jgi:mRNA interferase HicA